jgi:drug/metabolite transporter (DMT)-like permease
VGSSVAFILYYWLVRHMEVTNTMLISLVTPVLAVLLGMEQSEND